MPHFKFYVLLKILIHTQSKAPIPFSKRFDILFNAFQNNQFMLSWKQLVPHWIFQEVGRRVFRIFAPRLFRCVRNSRCPIFLDFQHIVFSKMIWKFPEFFGVIWWSHSPELLVLAPMVTSARFEKHENDDLSVFPTWNRKVTSPKWSRIILQSFWATFWFRIIIKFAPQTP